VVRRRRAVSLVDSVRFGRVMQLLAAIEPEVAAVTLLDSLSGVGLVGVQRVCHDGIGLSWRQGRTCERKSVKVKAERMRRKRG